MFPRFATLLPARVLDLEIVGVEGGADDQTEVLQIIEDVEDRHHYNMQMNSKSSKVLTSGPFHVVGETLNDAGT